MPGRKGVFGIHKVRDDPVVDFDDNAIADGDDVLRPPRIVLDQLFADFVEIVKGAGLLRIGTRVLDLRFEPLGQPVPSAARKYIPLFPLWLSFASALNSRLV